MPTVSLPFGMSKLLECMIRAVVIEKPENMPRFLADYASALLLYRNQNPSMELKEVMIQFQNRREVMKRSPEATRDKVRDVGKKSGTSSFLTSEEAVLRSKETLNGEDRSQSSKVRPTKTLPEDKLQQKIQLDEEVVLLSSEENLNDLDRTQSSPVTSPESVVEVKLLQETKPDQDTHLARVQTEGKIEQVPLPKSSVNDINTETKTVVLSERLSSSLSPSFLASSAAAARSYPSADSQCPGRGQDFRASTSLEDEENSQYMWTLYHLPHREEEGTLSTTVLSQPQYQNGAKIQVIGPGYVLVTKCPSSGTQTEVKCISSHCSKVSTQGLGQDCLMIKPPPYQHNI
ncbi:hypothetical protein Baya_3277 [Bagarius yarrelli]|uniref:Calcium-binding tyrosine phosphorylation-regulated protein n=1 Tax=Bagarius yarrelli TaxID=175774 RepID=A0A556TS73_BAGYA|nr:hypothetical protein Baya_3277 [Bagarius yarrelli]